MKKIIHALLGFAMLAALLFTGGSPELSSRVKAQAPEPPPADGAAAVEAARAQGPAAVVALQDTLDGEALDLAMDEIIAAHEQMFNDAPPPEDALPVSEAEEEAQAQAQMALAAENRAADLAQTDNPAADEPEQPAPQEDAILPSLATTRTVGSAPCAYGSVAAAVAASSPGDTLLLEGGVALPANLLITKSLTIRGGYDHCGSGSAGITTLDGGGAGRVIFIYENLSVTLENLNIINGNTAGNGAGIFVRWNTQLTATRVNIYNNTSALSGGGLRLYGGTAALTSVKIHDNTATEGAGVFGDPYTTYTPTLNMPVSTDVYSNDALTGSGTGGGIYMKDGAVTIGSCSDVFANHAIQGGGVYLINSTLTMGGGCSEIMSNTATGSGGGIHATNSNINLDNDAALYNNRAAVSGGSGNGGGAYLDNSDLLGDHAAIIYNRADDHGGGVFAANGSLLDLDLGTYACTGRGCSQVSFNTATNMYGGGVYATGGSEIDLRQTYIEGNTAYYGGGLYAYQSTTFLYNALLSRNNATANVGDGLRLFTGASLTGSQNTLARNNAAGAATGVAISMLGSTLAMSNSIIWWHTTSIDLAGQTVTCSNIQGAYPGAGNIYFNPMFVASLLSDYHLLKNSLSVDACATGQTRDIDNHLRPTGVRYDMGAYELYYFSHLPLLERGP